MSGITHEEINIICDSDNNIAIFDCDYWEEGKQESQKNIKNQNVECDEGLLNEINKEIQNSKTNFCKIKIVNKQNQIKKSKVKSLKKIQALINSNSNRILKQGYMQKKTDGFFFKWHRRFIALTSQKLFMFENELKEKVIGCVNFKVLPASIREQQENLFLDFEGECESLIFKCEDFQKEEWKMCLEHVINFHKKSDKLMIKTIVKPLYDFKDSITQKQFLKICETGDLLLFQTKNTGAKIQRVLTNSEVDHAAMIVKFKNRQIMVFESNLTYGVSVYSWNNYIKYFDLYERVILRKLNYLRREEVHPILLNFVKKNIGKKYQISPVKLLKFESNVDWDQINEEKEKDRGYFCSQLVAKAFKSLGLLDQKLSSGRYWPVDFSEKNGLLLKKGAWLGPEQTVILNKHLKNKI